MMVKSFIDMSRPQMLYGAGVGLIMLLSLLTSNMPALAFSAYVDLPFRKELCAALFVLGSLFAVLTVQRHMARAQKPWRVPQSQVAIAYLAFFVTTLVAVAIAR